MWLCQDKIQSPGVGGTPRKIGRRCAFLFLKTLTLFHSKNSDIPSLFQLLHGWLDNLRRALLMGVSPNDEEASSKKLDSRLK